MKQQLPFAVKWKIAENDLIALKDSANGCLVSTFVTTLSGIQYRLQIYPNGNRESNRGKVFVFLVLKFGNIKEIEVKCTVKVESAKQYSQEIDYTFKKSGGWGKYLCDTTELFDAQKEFIRDGKLELKVDGMFFFEDGKVFSNPCFSALGDELWANEESKDLQIIVDGKVVKVHKIIFASASPVFNEMLTSKPNEAIKCQLEITEFSYDIVKFSLKEIYGCSFSLKNITIDVIVSFKQFYEKYDMPSFKDRYAQLILRLTEESVPQVDGICEIKKNGSVTNCNFSYPYSVGQKLFERNDSKDFKILVDGKVIMVHKFILAARSSTFASMFRSSSTEAVKNQMEVCDFSFNIVESAVKAIYQYQDGSTYNSSETLLVFQFLSKYDFPSVKDYSERIAIANINPATVCQLINCAIITNSKKLHEKCIEFLISAFATNTPLYDIGNLDKNVALRIVQRCGYRNDDKDAALKLLEESLCHIVYTRKENDSSSMISALK